LILIQFKYIIFSFQIRICMSVTQKVFLIHFEYNIVEKEKYSLKVRYSRDMEKNLLR